MEIRPSTVECTKKVTMFAYIVYCKCTVVCAEQRLAPETSGQENKK